MTKITVESDKPMVVIPIDEYEVLMETIEILSNPRLMKDLEDARRDLREGRTIDIAALRKQIYN